MKAPNPKNLSDQDLLKSTKELVQIERRTTAQVISHLQEIQQRRLYADLGCSSLFVYCTKILGYGEAAAYRRIQAAKITECRPELKDAVRQGELNLTNLCQLGKALDHPEIQKDQKAQDELLRKAKTQNTKDFEKTVMEKTKIGNSKGKGKKKESLRRSSSESHSLRVELSEVGKKKLLQAQGLMSSNKHHTLVEVIERALDHYIKSHSPEYAQSKPRVITHKSVTPALKAQVWKRAKGMCEYPGCGSEYRLQVEHLHPQGKGGGHKLQNLALYCASHNQRAAILTYGLKVMDRFLQ